MPAAAITKSPVTLLLEEWKAGDASAFDRLTPLIYSELRKIATARLRRERSGHTLQPTALVHEAFVRLAGPNASWENRGHFFAIAAGVMRRILIEYARGRKAEKRGGGAALLRIDDTGMMVASPVAAGHDLLEVSAALDHLETVDPRKAKAVELRFFGGFTTPEIADALELSTATVERDLRLALAWLRKQLQ